MLQGVRRASAAAGVAVMVIALGVLGIAAAGGPGGWESGMGSPGPLLVSVAALVGAAAIGLLAALAVAIYALWPEGRPHPQDVSTSRLLVRTLLFSIMVLAASYLGGLLREIGVTPALFGGADPSPAQLARDVTSRPFPWPAAVLGALVAFVILAARTRRVLAGGSDPVPTSPGAPLEELLDRLRVGLPTAPDPRAAVIAAYAGMIDLFAARGHPLLASETPGEYLDRVLPEVGIGDVAAHRLRLLYELARFSPHPIRQELSDGAASALRALREELEPA
jgi:uncharacterized protein DUF4129